MKENILSILEQRKEIAKEEKKRKSFSLMNNSNIETHQRYSQNIDLEVKGGE